MTFPRNPSASSPPPTPATTTTPTTLLHSDWVEHYYARCQTASSRLPADSPLTKLLLKAPRVRAPRAPRPDMVAKLGVLDPVDAAAVTLRAMPVMYPILAEAATMNLADARAAYHALNWVKEGTTKSEASGAPRRTSHDATPWTISADLLRRHLEAGFGTASALLAATACARPAPDRTLHLGRTFMPFGRLGTHVEHDRAEGDGVAVHYAVMGKTMLVPFVRVGGGPHQGAKDLYDDLRGNEDAVNALFDAAGTPEGRIVYRRTAPLPGRMHLLYWSLDQALKTQTWEGRATEIAYRFAANNIIELLGAVFADSVLPDFTRTVNA